MSVFMSAKSHVVIARSHTLDRFERAGCGFDGDVEAFRLVVALVEGQQKGCRAPIDFVIEREVSRLFPPQ